MEEAGIPDATRTFADGSRTLLGESQIEFCRPVASLADEEDTALIRGVYGCGFGIELGQFRDHAQAAFCELGRTTREHAGIGDRATRPAS